MNFRPDVDEERKIALRSEARAWKSSGVITSEQLANCEAWARTRWSENRIVARTLLFIVTCVGIAAVGGFFEVITKEGEIFAAIVGIGAGLWLNLGRHFLHTGVEEACYVAGGTAAILSLPNTGAKEGILLFTVLLIICGVQLVNALFITAATAFALFYLADKFDPVIAAWASLAIAAVALLLQLLPIRRPYLDRAAAYHLVLFPAVAYATYRGSGPSLFASDSATSLFAGTPQDLGFAVLVALLAGCSVWSGLRRRSHAPLLGAMVTVALLTFDFGLMFTFAVEARLLIAGAAILAAVTAVSRALREEPQGFTARPIRESKLGLAEVLGAAMAVQTAHAGAAAPSGGPQVTEDHGSSFGGAGASGDY